MSISASSVWSDAQTQPRQFVWNGRTFELVPRRKAAPPRRALSGTEIRTLLVQSLKMVRSDHQPCLLTLNTGRPGQPAVRVLRPVTSSRPRSTSPESTSVPAVTSAADTVRDRAMADSHVAVELRMLEKRVVALEDTIITMRAERSADLEIIRRNSSEVRDREIEIEEIHRRLKGHDNLLQRMTDNLGMSATPAVDESVRQRRPLNGTRLINGP